MSQTTIHIGVRMSQRGITREMVEFARTYGRWERDRFVIGRKDLQRLLPSLADAERSTAMKLLDKGGVVVVETAEALITTYNFNSFDRRKRGREPARRARAYR